MTKEKSITINVDRVDSIFCSQCGCEIDVAGIPPFTRIECPDCTSIEVVPARLDNFLLLDLIGMGGMGGVYYARDEALGRDVAIKVMLSSLGANKEAMQNFLREAQAIAKLNHPNIVQIYSFGMAKSQPYIVMELVTGGKLDEMMEGGKQLDQGLIARIGLDVANALQAGYEIGLMHGDVKPENILLDDKMRAKLVDFGLARFVYQASNEEGIWGTPYYIAPEKVKRQKVDARSDIYSLGGTLYHALAGRPPFDGETPIDVIKKRLIEPPLPIKKFRPDIDVNLEKIIMRMLEQDPSLRYPTYASLISDLEKVTGYLKPDITKKEPKVGKGKPLIIKKGLTVVKSRSTKSIKPVSESKSITQYAEDRIKKESIKVDTKTLSVIKERKEEKKGKNYVWVYGILVILLIGLIGAVSVTIYNIKQEQERIRREKILLKKYKEAIENHMAEISILLGKFETFYQKSLEFSNRVCNALIFVTGRKLEEFVNPVSPVTDKLPSHQSYDRNETKYLSENVSLSGSFPTKDDK